MALPGIPPWNGQDIVLYHGTLAVHVSSILRAVDVTKGNLLKDFGRGFYTTTNRIKAEAWANSLVLHSTDIPAVVQLIVSRDTLAELDHLIFVRGDANAIDYWSFVSYCRTTAGDHNRIFRSGWYDVVAGPVTGSWRKQSLVPNADQISFHTPLAAAMLNQCAKVRIV